MADLVIDQACHRTHTAAVLPSVLTIRLLQRLITTQPPDAMFHHKAPLRKGPVGGRILLRTGFAPRFAPRGRSPRRSPRRGVQVVQSTDGAVPRPASPGPASAKMRMSRTPPTATSQLYSTRHGLRQLAMDGSLHKLCS